MREEESNWFSRWEEELPSPEELMPLTQTLITPHLALAFEIPNPSNPLPPPPPSTHLASSTQPNSSEFADSADLGSFADESARTLKRPRLVWTPQLHKRFVDAVAHLGIKAAVPKTIMQLMSVDGLTRENVASHLQKYRLYLKRMQGLSSGRGSAGVGAGGVDPATDHLFSSSPIPPHFLQPHSCRPNSDHFLPFVPQHHHPQLQPQYHRLVGYIGSPPNGPFEHPLVHRVGEPLHNSMLNHVEDLELANANGGRKVLTLFPTGDD